MGEQPQNTAVQKADPTNLFYPSQPNPDYAKFLELRNEILNLIRSESVRKTKIVNELVDILLDKDSEIPKSILEAALSLFKIAKKVHNKEKRREIYQKASKSILEKIFDPVLEFKLTKLDILDCLEAHGMDRDKISSDQINQVYVKIIEHLQAGDLRDLAMEKHFYPYVTLKLREIKISRQDWQINGR